MRRPKPGWLRRNELTEEREAHPNAPLRRGSAMSLSRAQQPPGLFYLLFRGARDSTGAYLTAGITSTRVGGATRVTEVREGGLIYWRAESWAQGKGKRKGDRREELDSPSPSLTLVEIIYLASIQDNYLRHRLSTLARLIVG